jgi:DNA invertase Pin-like site-specific DNA recombinase
MQDLMEITKRIKAAGAHLQVLQMGLNTATATGELMLNMLGSIAQWERQMMLERQREGIEKAKAEGKYKGRKPTARAKHITVKELADQGFGATEIAKKAGIGRASVYRILGKDGQQ